VGWHQINRKPDKSPSSLEMFVVHESSSKEFPLQCRLVGQDDGHDQ